MDPSICDFLAIRIRRAEGMMPKLPLAFGVWQTDAVLFIDFETPFLNPVSLSYD